MVKIHTIPLHIGDLLGGTSGMDGTEFGAYTLLFIACYQAADHKLPSDEERLSRIARVTPKVWRRIRGAVLKKFKTQDDALTHHRVQKEVEKIARMATKNKDNSLKRWKSEIPLDKPKATEAPKKAGQPSLFERGENQKPETTSQKPSDKYNNPHAEDFWKGWPSDRRAEKPKFYAAWKDAVRKIPAAQLIECGKRYLETKQAKEGYAPYPARWLKYERWLEVMEEGRDGLAKLNLTVAELGGNTEQNIKFLEILEALKKSLGEAIFRSWLGHLRLREKNSNAVIITAPSQFMVSWIGAHYFDDLRLAIKKVWPEISFIDLTF
jgi:uncharacterized protein YdaU (DUF1376 family)